MKKTTILILLSIFIFTGRSMWAAAPENKNYLNGIKCYDRWEYGDAWKYFVAADEEEPNNGYIYYNAARTAFLLDNPQVSLKLLLKSFDYFKEDEIDGLGDAYLYMGFLAESAWLYDLDIQQPAIYYYNKAVECNPSDYNVWLKRGIFLDFNMQDFVNSNADFEKAIQLAKNEVETYTRLGQSYEFEQNRLDDAIDVYRRSVANIKEYPYHHDDLARLLIKKGEFDEAAEVLLSGMEMAKEEMSNYSSIYDLPAKQKDYLKKQIEKRSKENPTEGYWIQYLNALQE